MARTSPPVSLWVAVESFTYDRGTDAKYVHPGAVFLAGNPAIRGHEAFFRPLTLVVEDEPGLLLTELPVRVVGLADAEAAFSWTQLRTAGTLTTGRDAAVQHRRRLAMTAPVEEGEVSERVLSRAKAILWQGGITIRLVDDYGRVVAEVGAYRVRRTVGGRWSCECAAATFGQHCSHVEAVRLVT